MARILLKHSLAPNELVIPITVNIYQADLKETNDGEVIFILTFDCGAIDSDGNKIDTVVINNVTEETVKKEIQRGLTIIGDQIPWKNLQADTSPPKIDQISPKYGEENVSIEAHVYGTIRDTFPTTGIDQSTIKLKVNDIDVTDELQIVGADTEYNIRWIPTKKI